MSSTQSTKSRIFKLKILEPRLLLSAEALGGCGIDPLDGFTEGVSECYLPVEETSLVGCEEASHGGADSADLDYQPVSNLFNDVEEDEQCAGQNAVVTPAEEAETEPGAPGELAVESSSFQPEVQGLSLYVNDSTEPYTRTGSTADRSG